MSPAYSSNSQAHSSFPAASEEPFHVREVALLPRSPAAKPVCKTSRRRILSGLVQVLCCGARSKESGESVLATCPKAPSRRLLFPFAEERARSCWKRHTDTL